MNLRSYSTVRATVAALAMAGLVLTGCSSASAHHPASSATPTMSAASTALATSPAGVRVQVARTALGQLLATNHGYTLYTFALDKTGTSVCTGACATTWPPFLVDARSPLIPTAGLAGRLGTTSRPGGDLQATWNGHPLYTFSGDTAPGQTHGQGIKGLWSVVTIDPTAASASATSTHAPMPPVPPAATSRRPGPSTPPARTSAVPSSTVAPSTPPRSSTPPPTNCIPQGGGGDGDGDNSGGPSDGDGCT